MSFPRTVRIREVGPREGFQTLPEVVSTSKKLELIESLNKTRVGVIEIASFVRPDRVPQMADAEVIVKNCANENGTKYVALYLNRTGFERAEATKRLENDAWITASASPTFLRRNSNTTLEALVAELPQWCSLFDQYKKNGIHLMLSSAFGCSYEGKISTEKLINAIEFLNSGLRKEGKEFTEICLADTVGMGNPEEVREKIKRVRVEFPNAEVSLHLHDTRGSGIANVYAGLLEGVETFDASVGGMGGCPFTKGAAGNVSTEDVAYLCEELGIPTGLDLTEYVKAAQLAATIVGHELPGKFYKSLSKR